MRLFSKGAPTASATLLAVAGLVDALWGCGSGGGGGGTTIGPTPTIVEPTPHPSASPSAAPPTASPIASPLASPSPAARPPLRLTEVAAGLDQPLFATTAPGDPSRLYVVEQSGRIRIVESGALRAAPFLDLSGLVSCCGERGLLGLAFHPGYADNGRFFVNYTNSRGDTEIVEYARAADPDVATPEPVRRFFTVGQPFANHNGGQLAFAPDGFLYIGLGDGGGSGDPNGNAQNRDSKLGKILRIDVDAYPTPVAGNLPGGDPDVWDYGLRNPWRFSFDRATGDLYIGDVGQDTIEEIDIEPAGEGGRNYGWNVMEGSQCFAEASCDPSGLTLPAAEYTHAFGCSVIGGYVYRGRAIPGLVGTYLYGDYCSSRVFSLRWVDGAVSATEELTADLDPDSRIHGLTSFGEDGDGELYVVSHDGSVFRIEAE
jgi:glucose/arabinose dehydrogenase